MTMRRFDSAVTRSTVWSSSCSIAAPSSFSQVLRSDIFDRHDFSWFAPRVRRGNVIEQCHVVSVRPARQQMTGTCSLGRRAARRRFFAPGATFRACHRAMSSG